LVYDFWFAHAAKVTIFAIFAKSVLRLPAVPLHFERIISLWGFMGSGKTYWGQHLASELGVPFVDLDRRIEDAAGQSVAELFADRGEVGFRTLEAEVLRSVLRSPERFVLATGGGTPCFFDNAEALLDQTLSVYLQAPAALLAQRLRTDRTVRPLLAQWPVDEWEERLTELLEKREPYYRKAHRTCPIAPGFPVDALAFVAWLGDNP
jgi:shikimate kinase